MTRPTKITLNKKALIHNVEQVKQHCPSSAVLAMVKANAYGHQAEFVAHTLAPFVQGFGVACLSEAMTLRRAGIEKPVVLLAGFFDECELKDIVKHNFSLVVHNREQLNVLLKTPLSKSIDVWLKINSTMNRLGFDVRDFQQAHQALSACAWVKKPLVLMTHLADADNRDASTTQAQLQFFHQETAVLPGLKSVGNSAAILSHPGAHSDWVRPGIMLYGISPFSDKTSKALNLKPVMTLSSQLIAIHHLQKGDKVGYNGTWEAPEAMPLGIVGVGYGDGYPRGISENTPVLIRGVRCPIVGRVSMDMLTVDLRACQNAQLYDEVVLWGTDLPIEIIAHCAGTIPYELATRVTSRVHVCFEGV